MALAAHFQLDAKCIEQLLLGLQLRLKKVCLGLAHLLRSLRDGRLLAISDRVDFVLNALDRQRQQIIRNE